MYRNKLSIDTYYNMDKTSKTNQITEARHKSSHTVLFHLFEISRTSKSTEAESRVMEVLELDKGD